MKHIFHFLSEVSFWSLSPVHQINRDPVLHILEDLQCHNHLEAIADINVCNVHICIHINRNEEAGLSVNLSTSSKLFNSAHVVQTYSSFNSVWVQLFNEVIFLHTCPTQYLCYLRSSTVEQSNPTLIVLHPLRPALPPSCKTSILLYGLCT